MGRPACYDGPYLAAAGPGPDDRVLDVGSGPGAMALALAGRAGSVVGVDLSTPLVDLARRRAAAGRENWFGTDPDDALGFLAVHHAGLLDELDDDARRRTLDALRADLAAHHTGAGVEYDSATWLVRATA